MVSSKIAASPRNDNPQRLEVHIVAGDCGSAEAEPFRKPNQRRFRFLIPQSAAMACSKRAG